MTGWPAIIACAIALLIAAGGYVVKKYPISETIIRVPLDCGCKDSPATRPTKPPIVDRRYGPRVVYENANP